MGYLIYILFISLNYLDYTFAAENLPQTPTSLQISSSPQTPTSLQISSSPQTPTSLQISSSPQTPTSLQISSSPQTPTSLQISSSPQTPTSLQISSSPQTPTSPQISSSPQTPTSQSPDVLEVTVTDVKDFPKPLIGNFLIGVNEIDLFTNNPGFLKTNLWFHHRNLEKGYIGLWRLIFDFFYHNKKPQDKFELAFAKAFTQMSAMRTKAYPHNPPIVMKAMHCQHVFKVLKIQKCDNTYNFMIYLVSLTYGLSSYIQKAIVLLFVIFCTHSVFFGLDMKKRVDKFLGNKNLRDLLTAESHESLTRYVTQCHNESPRLFRERDSTSVVSHNLSIPFIFIIRSPQTFGNLSCLTMIELYRSGVSDSLEFPSFLLFFLPRMQSASSSLLILYLLMEVSSLEGSYHIGIRHFFTNSGLRKKSLEVISNKFGVNLNGFLYGFIECMINYERSEMLPGAEELNLPEAKNYAESIRNKK